MRGCRKGLSNIYDDKSKDKKIKKELSKLNKVFKTLPENQKKIVEKLIDSAAFTAICMEELQEIINAEGYEVEYQNGANQSGVKQSVSLSSYLALQKNYTKIIDTLMKYIPEDEKNKAGGKLAEFVNAFK
jgi:hypothetical protein